MVEKAYHFADKAHADQKRNSGEPYIIHPAFVASVLTELMLDAPTVAAGLLHDTLEDVDWVTMDVLREEFSEEVAQLVERIKKTEATNRAQIRKYEKELGTLRSIMRNYITQIDSLNTLNHKLTADAAAARKEAAESRKANKELTQQVESLSGQVAAGSVLKARGIRLEAYNSADKVTDRSSRVVRMLTTLSLVENDLAPKGPVRVYIRVKDPGGILLTNGTQVSFNYQGSTMMASASREVDYEGKEVELSIYLNDIPAYEKGIYTVEAYTAQSFLGSAEVLLR
jgi:hypothetical protein